MRSRPDGGTSPRRPLEPAWRFWAKELTLFAAGVGVGWYWWGRRRRAASDDVVALSPDERAELESREDSL